MGDFKPFDCKHGEYISWDASNLTHGNKINVTSITRVSFDFRVIPGFAYDENCKLESCTTKQKFIVVEYYEQVQRSNTASMYDPIENAKLGQAC